MIDSCGFGKIVIDGSTFNSDLIIFPDGQIIDSWRRKRGHRLSKEDIDHLISAKPDVIIVGTGVYGRMKSEKELKLFLNKNDIQLIEGSNKKAIKIYNELAGIKKTGACFHLTC